MKIVAKYIWILLFIPAYFFIGGDAKMGSLFHVSSSQPVAAIATTIQSAVKPAVTISYAVKINPVRVNEYFSADGMPVQLFDENYELIQSSQVVNGMVRFEIPARYVSKGMLLNLVSPKTADEMKITNIIDEATFSINEAQLTEVFIHH